MLIFFITFKMSDSSIINELKKKQTYLKKDIEHLNTVIRQKKKMLGDINSEIKLAYTIEKERKKISPTTAATAATDEPILAVDNFETIQDEIGEDKISAAHYGCFIQ